MKAIRLQGLDGATPLGFIASLGLLNVVEEASRGATPTLAWTYQGTWVPELYIDLDLDGVVESVFEDLKRPAVQQVLGLQYPKVEKKGVKAFAGLRPPVGILRHWLHEALEHPDRGTLDYFSALMCEAVTEPIPTDKRPTSEDLSFSIDASQGDALAESAAQTVFDFTSKNQQFLDQARLIACDLCIEEIRSELLGASEGVAGGRTMGWDSREDKPGALFTQVLPPRYPALEWLAFRSLPFFPVHGDGGSATTTACRGRRKQGHFRWCVWTPKATRRGVASLLQLIRSATAPGVDRSAVGVAEVFESELGKGADGYSGVFRPVTAV